MIWKTLEISVLTVFYAVYLGKMLQQKKQGIRTDHMAKGDKDKSLVRTEAVMKLVTYGIVLVQLINILCGWSLLPPGFRGAGFVSGLAGVAVFTAAIVTMQDSWRAGIPEQKETGMITGGIYQYSRNPAFLGFYLNYLGILLMFFHWLLLLFTVIAIGMLHLQILQEEKYLSAVFGEAYEDYRRNVRRYF